MDFPHSDVSPPGLTSSVDGKGPGHELLDRFVGHWSVQGKNPLASVEADEDITGVETFQWLTGEYFLEYRWDRVLAHGWHHGVAMIGYDAEEEVFFAHFYDNLGFHRRYEVGVEANRLTFEGKHERGELRLDESCRKMQIHWERSERGDWQRLCDLTGTRTA